MLRRWRHLIGHAESLAHYQSARDTGHGLGGPQLAPSWNWSATTVTNKHPTGAYRQSCAAGFQILLIEDNSAHAQLLQEAITELDGDVPFSLTLVPDGETAMQRLHERLNDPDAPLPDLALIDLGLPGRDGCEIVEAIRAEPALQQLPVIIWTSSASAEDARRAYAVGANSYLTKPMDLDTLISQVKALAAFWFGAARLPGDGS